MNKFIKNIIHFSLRHRYFVFFLTLVLAVTGFISYQNTPIETFPDVTNTQVIIITQWPGRSAEEVEKFVTIPLETVLNSVQKKTNLRTTSSFGLSYVRIIFDDDVDDAPASKAKAKPAEDTNADDSDDVDSDDDGGNQFTALAKDLFKLGVFTSEEDDEEAPIGNAEEFLERFNAEKKKGAVQIVNDFIGQFGEDYQNAFQAIFVKGVDPKDYFGTYNAIENYAEMDLSNESNQIAVLKQALADQGFDPEDIETEVERLKNYGDLETVAARHHKVLVKKEAAKLQQLEQEKERQLQQQAAIKQQYMQNVYGNHYEK